MRLKTMLQLGSFFPILMVALFVVYLLMAHLTGGDSGGDGSVLPGASVLCMAVFALLGGWGFYRLGRGLVAQISALETMAERVRHGDLTALPQVPASKVGGVAAVADVFSDLVTELRGYVELIGAHEKLKRERGVAMATADRLREAALPVSSALERLRRAEQGVMAYLLADGRAVLDALPAGAFDDAADDAGPGLSGTTSVKEALEEALRLCRESWSRGPAAIEAAVTCRSEGPFDVRADRAGLVQAFAAVLHNGADAMPEGGTIDVQLGTDSDGTVSVAIADTGVGMGEAVRKRCMSPFFSTREDRLGLGLALARRILSRAEGRLGIISEPGHGATVHMTFPAPRVGTEASATAAPSREPLTILLVEDDAATRETLANLLSRERHRVTAVEDGPAAILALRNKTFDAVVTDRAMPIMTGDELAAAIKARHPSTAVVMVTGMGEEMERRHQRPHGVDVVLAKPVRHEDLKRGLARAMDVVAAAS